MMGLQISAPANTEATISFVDTLPDPHSLYIRHAVFRRISGFRTISVYSGRRDMDVVFRIICFSSKKTDTDPTILKQLAFCVEHTPQWVYVEQDSELILTNLFTAGATIYELDKYHRITDLRKVDLLGAYDAKNITLLAFLKDEKDVKMEVYFIIPVWSHLKGTYKINLIKTCCPTGSSPLMYELGLETNKPPLDHCVKSWIIKDPVSGKEHTGSRVFLLPPCVDSYDALKLSNLSNLVSMDFMDNIYRSTSVRKGYPFAVGLDKAVPGGELRVWEFRHLKRNLILSVLEMSTMEEGS